jgi:hypothetical protein
VQNHHRTAGTAFGPLLGGFCVFVGLNKKIKTCFLRQSKRYRSFGPKDDKLIRIGTYDAKNRGLSRIGQGGKENKKKKKKKKEKGEQKLTIPFIFPPRF